MAGKRKKVRRKDAARYLTRGALALVLPFLFWLLQLSWRVDPALYDTVVGAFDGLAAVKVAIGAVLIILPLVASACGLMVLQCGGRNRMGSALGIAGLLLLVLLASSRPS